MKKILLLLAMTTLVFTGCKKEDGTDQDPVGNVQKAIDAVQNKSTARDLTISGELLKTDWAVLKTVKEQLPMLENITLADASTIESGVFAFTDGVAWEQNRWLKGIKAPKATKIKASAFRYCQVLVNVDFVSVETIEEDAFAVCESLKSIELSKAKVIAVDAFTACTALENLKFGAAEAIDFNVSEDSGLETENINLDLSGIEASQAIGTIWKNKIWKSISNNGVAIADADFGIANFGCTKDFVELNESKKAVSGGHAQKLIYQDNNNVWYIYNFDSNKKLISGTVDCSIQFGATPTELIFLPISTYLTELSKLKVKFGNPIYVSEDVFSFNATDKTLVPGNSFYESQLVMNNSKSFTYKFGNERTAVESVLSFYLRANKTQPWGFTIQTTYSPK